MQNAIPLFIPRRLLLVGIVGNGTLSVDHQKAVVDVPRQRRIGRYGNRGKPGAQQQKDAQQRRQPPEYMQFYRLISDNGYTTKAVKRLPQTRHEQSDYIGAEVLILCSECTLGSITEDKVWKYAKRISCILRMDMEPCYGLDAELFRLLWKTCSDTSLYLPELSYQAGVVQNTPVFHELLRQIALLEEEWFSPPYF